jgi:hypothetical protein
MKSTLGTTNMHDLFLLWLMEDALQERADAILSELELY